MSKKGAEKTVKKSNPEAMEEVACTRSFQVKMDEKVHSLLKKRAKRVGITIGEFIQNLLSSLEYRLEGYKVRVGIDPSFRNDALDARLIKLIMYADKAGLTQDDIEGKLENIKEEFKPNGYRPDITIDNGE